MYACTWYTEKSETFHTAEQNLVLSHVPLISLYYELSQYLFLCLLVSRAKACLSDSVNTTLLFISDCNMNQSFASLCMCTQIHAHAVQVRWPQNKFLIILQFVDKSY